MSSANGPTEYACGTPGMARLERPHPRKDTDIMVGWAVLSLSRQTAGRRGGDIEECRGGAAPVVKEDDSWRGLD